MLYFLSGDLSFFSFFIHSSPIYASLLPQQYDKWNFKYYVLKEEGKFSLEKHCMR